MATIQKKSPSNTFTIGRPRISAKNQSALKKDGNDHNHGTLLSHTGVRSSTNSTKEPKGPSPQDQTTSNAGSPVAAKNEKSSKWAIKSAYERMPVHNNQSKSTSHLESAFGKSNKTEGHSIGLTYGSIGRRKAEKSSGTAGLSSRSLNVPLNSPSKNQRLEKSESSTIHHTSYKKVSASSKEFEKLASTNANPSANAGSSTAFHLQDRTFSKTGNVYKNSEAAISPKKHAYAQNRNVPADMANSLNSEQFHKLDRNHNNDAPRTDQHNRVNNSEYQMLTSALQIDSTNDRPSTVNLLTSTVDVPLPECDPLWETSKRGKIHRRPPPPPQNHDLPNTSASTDTTATDRDFKKFGKNAQHGKLPFPQERHGYKSNDSSAKPGASVSANIIMDSLIDDLNSSMNVNNKSDTDRQHMANYDLNRTFDVPENTEEYAQVQPTTSGSLSKHSVKDEESPPEFPLSYKLFRRQEVSRGGRSRKLEPASDGDTKNTTAFEQSRPTNASNLIHHKAQLDTTSGPLKIKMLDEAFSLATEVDKDTSKTLQARSSDRLTAASGSKQDDLDNRTQPASNDCLDVQDRQPRQITESCECECCCSRLRMPPPTHLNMSKAGVGKAAPDFKGQAVVDGEFKEVKLADYKGRYLVFFFYPNDFTFVCPTEIIAFADRSDEFRAIGCDIVACSTDSEYSHLAWIQTSRKMGGLGEMKIPVLADPAHCISRDYGVLIEEKGYAIRGLFIIDGKGILRQITMNDLSVGRDVDEVLRLVQAYQYVDKHGEVCPAGWKPGKATIKPNKAKEYFNAANK